jgi:hypothetical protein
MDRRELRFHAQEQNDTIQCKNITTPSNLDNLITNIFYFISKLLGDLSNLALTRFTRSKWPIYNVIYKKSCPGVPTLNLLEPIGINIGNTSHGMSQQIQD